VIKASLGFSQAGEDRGQGRAQRGHRRVLVDHCGALKSKRCDSRAEESECGESQSGPLGPKQDGHEGSLSRGAGATFWQACEGKQKLSRRASVRPPIRPRGTHAIDSHVCDHLTHVFVRVHQESQVYTPDSGLLAKELPGPIELRIGRFAN
jgi:hypothetical protein